jgi:hypothetical protein
MDGKSPRRRLDGIHKKITKNLTLIIISGKKIMQKYYQATRKSLLGVWSV